MTLILSIISAALGAVIILAAVFVIKKRLGGNSASEIAALQTEIGTVAAQMDGLLATADDVATKAQLDNITQQANALVADLEQQKGMLKQIEDKLDSVQKEVETKETAQQEVKSAKEEDDAKLQELLAAFGDVTNQSTTLEQQLAASLKNLDTLMNETNVTDDQKAVLGELSKTLTNAGSRLRDLIMDYKAVNERLDGLRIQHADLENEYTKLVEQQLGA